MRRVVSGGQTGVDRGALDAAIALGLPHGGWCPRGRRAEDGVIPPRYDLRETPHADYAQRTAWNVRDADGTLILALGALSGGTALTRDLAERSGKPLLVLDLDTDARRNAAALRHWLAAEGVATLNVAGPRENGCPGIGARAEAFLREALA